MKVYVIEVGTNSEGGGAHGVHATVESARNEVNTMIASTKDRWDKYRELSDPDEVGNIENFGIFKQVYDKPDFLEWTDGSDYISIRGFEVKS